MTVALTAIIKVSFSELTASAEVISRATAPKPSASAPQKIASSGASNKPAAYKTTIAISTHSTTFARVIPGDLLREAFSSKSRARPDGAGPSLSTVFASPASLR